MALQIITIIQFKQVPLYRLDLSVCKPLVTLKQIICKAIITLPVHFEESNSKHCQVLPVLVEECMVCERLTEKYRFNYLINVSIE